MSRRTSRKRQQAMNARRRSGGSRVIIFSPGRRPGLATLRRCLAASPNAADAFSYMLASVAQPKPDQAEVRRQLASDAVTYGMMMYSVHSDGALTRIPPIEARE